MKPLSYSEVGVSYEAMDPWKRACQAAARSTDYCLEKYGLERVEWSRGESAFLMESSDCYFGHVQEGLGTKNLIADAMYKLTGKSFYDSIARDLVGMILNDLITLGVAPVSVALHLASGDSNWFRDERRAGDFIEGFRSACAEAGATWGPGESPTLPQIVDGGTVEISGSAFGIAKPKSRLIIPNIQDDDAIVLVESSGIHANGLTLARRIAQHLPGGYLTPVDDLGTTYGESLLRPTLLYTRLVDSLLIEKVPLHYTIHITGHGWRKLMRHRVPFTYVIEELPVPPQPFPFIQQHGPVTDEEAYANFNMGAGFALIMPPASVESVEQIAGAVGLTAWRAGTVQRSSLPRVELRPKGIVYSAESLSLR